MQKPTTPAGSLPPHVPQPSSGCDAHDFLSQPGSHLIHPLILKQSRNNNSTEGNFESCSHSVISRNEQGVSRPPPLHSHPANHQDILNESTLTVKNSEERSESKVKMSRNRQGEVESISKFFEESPRKENQTTPQLNIPKARTEKTIAMGGGPGMQRGPSCSNLNGIIDSLSTKRNLNEKEKELKEVIVLMEDQTESISLDEEMVASGRFLTFNDSIGSIQNSDHYQLIWKQDDYELKDLEIHIRQRESDSQSQSDGNLQLEVPVVDRTYSQAEGDNQYLKQTIAQLRQDLLSAKQEKQALETQMAVCQTGKQLKDEKYNSMQQQNQQLKEEGKELNDLVQSCKEEAYRNQVAIEGYKNQVEQLQVELGREKKKTGQKEQDIGDLVNLIHDKNLEYEEVVAMTRELEEFIRGRTSQFESESGKMQSQIVELQETVEEYKDRLQQDGFTFNLDEVQHLKQIFQCQEERESLTVKSLVSSHEHSIAHLEQENRGYQSELQQLKHKASPVLQLQQQYQQRYNLMHSQTQQLVEEYDFQLQLRDDEILTLKRQAFQQKELEFNINLDNCKVYLRQVDRLTSLIADQSAERFRPAELVIQFVYIVDKLCRMFKMAQRKLEFGEKERQGVARVAKAKDLLFQQELDGLRWDLHQVEKEKQFFAGKYKQINARYCQLKEKQNQKHRFETVDNQPVSPPLASSSLIISKLKGSTPSSHLYETCSISLKQESKINCLTLEQVLMRKTIQTSKKRDFSAALVDFAQNLLNQASKPMPLKLNQIQVTAVDDSFRLELMNLASSPTLRGKEESEKALFFYVAPEVLLGFGQSEQSYVWTLGLILDELFHGSFFYRRINLITAREENYRCRDQQLEVRMVLEGMLRKKQRDRWSLQRVQSTLARADSALGSHESALLLHQSVLVLSDSVS